MIITHNHSEGTLLDGTTESHSQLTPTPGHHLHMSDESGLAEVKAAMAETVAQMPTHLRVSLPTNADGEPQVEMVRALYRYERTGPSNVRWIQIRELSDE